MPKWWRTYGPNTSDGLALVSLRDERLFRAYRPIRVTQLFGGKRWSLSVVRFATDTPLVVALEESRSGEALTMVRHVFEKPRIAERRASALELARREAPLRRLRRERGKGAAGG